MKSTALKCINVTSLVAQTIKSLPAMQETWDLSLVWEDALEKKMATQSGEAPGQRSLAG